MEYALVSEIFPQPVDIVWAIAGDFGGLERWVAGVDVCAVEGKGVGAVRTVRRLGHIVRERLDTFDAARHSLSYSILEPHRLPATGLRSSIKLHGTSAGGTEMVWRSQALTFHGSAAELTALVEAFFRESADRLRQLLNLATDGSDP